VFEFIKTALINYFTGDPAPSLVPDMLIALDIDGTIEEQAAFFRLLSSAGSVASWRSTFSLTTRMSASSPWTSAPWPAKSATAATSISTGASG
jgi:hypothetical protein